jgi:hypothetical protein
MFEPEIRAKYDPRDKCPEVKRNISSPTIKGNTNPDIKPVITLSYFSEMFIS